MWKPGKLARNTMVVFIGTGFRALAQAIVFLVVIRVLGIESYGAFVAVLAIANGLSGLCGFGSPVLMVRDVVRNPKSFPQSWGAVLAISITGIPLVFSGYLVISYAILPNSIPFSVIILIGINEIIFWPLSNATVFAYQGYERMGRASRMMLAPAAARFLGVIVLMWIRDCFASDALLLWSSLYVLSGLFTFIYSHFMVYHDLGKPAYPSKHQLFQYTKEGFPFSFWAISEKLYVDADKAMLARMSTLDVTGTYSAGYRFVDLAFLPLHSLLNAASPRFFRAAEAGIGNAFRYSGKICIAPFLYGLTVGVLLFYIAPFLPYVIGDDRGEVVYVTQWLAWLPVATLPRLLTQYAIASSGFQKAGAMAVLVGAVANVTLNWWWIPTMGWRGAVQATYIAEAIMSLQMLSIIVYQKGRD